MGVKKLYSLLATQIHLIDVNMGRDKFFDLLRNTDLLVKSSKKYVITTQSFGYINKYKDFYNKQIWTAAHQCWVCDLTYIRLESKFQYLFLLTDAFSRKIVGWCLCDTMETIYAEEALKMALKQCPNPKGLVHHSDRGFQYTSHRYTKMLLDASITISMGQIGYCYDNAMAERVNGILKGEYNLEATFKDEKQALNATKQAIYYYNTQRPHWSLNLKIPNDVHQHSVLSTLNSKKMKEKSSPNSAKKMLNNGKITSSIM